MAASQLINQPSASSLKLPNREELTAVNSRRE